MRLMQRGEGLELDQVIQDGLGHADRSVVLDAAMDHPVTEGRDRPSFEQCASRRDDLPHGGAVIESLRCNVPLLDDTAIRVGDFEAWLDADALHLPPKGTAFGHLGVIDRELDARNRR